MYVVMDCWRHACGHTWLFLDTAAMVLTTDFVVCLCAISLALTNES